MSDWPCRPGYEPAAESPGSERGWSSTISQTCLVEVADQARHRKRDISASEFYSTRSTETATTPEAVALASTSGPGASHYPSDEIRAISLSW